ncbi:GAF domain-containing protein [Phenylobacterium deserti]|uniref:Transcriptional regulator n=1 Tax=Phenylobacterium deserti TaxID=1914756 RepID=A0A328AA44_9CAUL|nr:GAF domain-containing protein [Phenylobacterium deserti]RAK51415.1 transcriptional regulator [Phenylobacterium deserti]
MSVRLRQILDCFEGVIPSVIATVDADGTPNVSYLSQVWFVDDEHVALSNQFFSKTAANVAATGQATVLVVDGRTGAQYMLDLAWVRSEAAGDLFDRMAAHLEAISTVHGTEQVMQLRSAEVYRVRICSPVPGNPIQLPEEQAHARGDRLPAAARLAGEIAAETDADAMIQRLLDGLGEAFGYEHAMVLVPELQADRLITLASRGYHAGGAGAETPMGRGAVGIAAKTGRAVRLCDMSRGRRLARAVESQAELDEGRTIPLPGLAEPQSQLAAPMLVQGQVSGVLFAEASERFRFGREDEQILSLLGAQLAASLRLAELEARSARAAAAAPAAPAQAQRSFQVRHYAFDDSVFIDGDYVIKGVPGRLLAHFLRQHLADGRRTFTNREIRLDASLRLPELKDNLETRLILLRRRLDERAGPVRLARPGRGVIELVLDGAPSLETVAA